MLFGTTSLKMGIKKEGVFQPSFTIHKLETVSYKSLKWRMSAGGIKEGLIISHMNRVSKSVVDFFSDKSEEEIQKYIALCEQAELIKN